MLGGYRSGCIRYQDIHNPDPHLRQMACYGVSLAAKIPAGAPNDVARERERERELTARIAIIHNSITIVLLSSIIIIIVVVIIFAKHGFCLHRLRPGHHLWSLLIGPGLCSLGSGRGPSFVPGGDTVQTAEQKEIGQNHPGRGHKSLVKKTDFR